MAVADGVLFVTEFEGQILSGAGQLVAAGSVIVDGKIVVGGFALN